MQKYPPQCIDKFICSNLVHTCMQSFIRIRCKFLEEYEPQTCQFLHIKQKYARVQRVAGTTQDGA